MNLNFLNKDYIALVCLFLSFSMVAQDNWKEITTDKLRTEFAKVSDYYKSNSEYSFKITHSSYKDVTDVEPYETKSGFMMVNEDEYYSDLLGVKTIQNKKVKVIIDSANKIMAVNNPDDNFKSSWDQFNQDKSFEIVDKAYSRNLNNNTEYKVIYKKGFTLSSLVMGVSSAGWVQKATFNYQPMEIYNEQIGEVATYTPKVTILYSSQKDSSAKEEVFDLKNYLRRDGKTYIPSMRYNEYEFADMRFK